ncbi:DUF4159 domain-containing protein, partial [Candidatus Poribacteria bacterium]
RKNQKYEPRPQPVRPIMRPSAPRTQVIDTNSIPVDTPERSALISGRPTETAALPRFSDQAMQHSGSPSSLTRNKIEPRIMTTAQVLPSKLTLSPAIAGGSSGPGDGIGNRPGTSGTGTGGSGGGHSQGILAAIKPTQDRQSLSMINIHTALGVDESLTDVAQGVTLGRQRVQPLPKGQPGGIVAGRGKDMEGHIRFTRLKHDLADWWADPTSIPAVMHWMNTQTKIRADMNVEGGSLRLDDPKLMKCPLAIMTGHDRAIMAGRISGNYRNKLTEQERAGLRRYLIDEGGFLFFDECGHDLALARMVKNELRTTLPEHSVERIPNQHELYTCYYDLGGPPPGAYRFWKHGVTRGSRAKIGKYLEGIFIDDRLAVLISNRDYLCAARSKNRPGHGNTGEDSPPTYRFLTNVIIYSLTHGNISEHSDYVPEMTDADSISIDSPVLAPALVPR